MAKIYEDQIILLLKRLWLTDNECQIFICSLKTWPSTVIQLAKYTQLKRITAHAVIERLLEKWLLLKTYNKKKRLIYPNTVDSLERLLEKKKYEIKSLQEDIQKNEPILKSIQSRSRNFPKVRFYKGKEWIDIMLNEVIQDKEDMNVISDSQHFNDLIDNDFLEKSLAIRNKYHLNIKMIFPSGFEHFCYTQGTYKQKLDIWTLPTQDILVGGMTVRGKKIAYHCYEQGFITTTIVEDDSISNIMRFMFQNVWMNAKK